MKRSRQRGQLDFRRSGVAAFGEEWPDSRQQPLQLFAFRRLLFAVFIPTRTSSFSVRR